MPNYNTHLCTFMGRKFNVEILLQYVENALRIDAIDHYHMIDMTRNFDDHEYINKEQQRLNELYPGRVHIVNREVRAKQLKDDTAMDIVGSWSPFYKYVSTFKDNDVIIKCDDDTLYFDIETIRAAAEFRWNNKQPYIMHANCINNGVCAYHQNKNNIWTKVKNKQLLSMYPDAGLTGCLFSDPDIACDMHEQFTNDLKSGAGIDKYKLKKNINFCNRVSINFIFMLGSDRDTISKIDRQDEYEISSKIPNRLDRPNTIIGDFICAHHTYGPQEPVMEERGTQELYIDLVKKIDFSNCTNKKITQKYNKPITIHDKNKYIGKYWATENSYTIKNKTIDKYLSIAWEKKEQMKFVDKKPIPSGVFHYMSKMTSGDEPMVFNFNKNKPSLFYLQESSSVIKATRPPNHTAKQYIAHAVSPWFQSGYKTHLIKTHQVPEGVRFESTQAPGFFLEMNILPNGNTLLQWKQDGDQIWELGDLSNNANDVVLVQIDKDIDPQPENDATTAKAFKSDLPHCRNDRGYYWMVKNYIWELESLNNDNYAIKLISDEHEDLYLNFDKEKLHVSNKKQPWSVNGNKITHIGSQVKFNHR